MNTLIYDIEISGHHSEYISHLVNYIVNDKPEGHFTFIVHPHFAKKFPQIIAESNIIKNIQFVAITDNEYKKTKKGNLVFRSFNIYRLMNNYARKHNVELVILLSLNIFQLALCFLKPKYKIRGIFFRPFVRMKKEGWLNKIKFARKNVQTWFLIRNKMIERVFILNDTMTVNFLNRKFKTTIFDMLPDPIPNLRSIPDFSIKSTYNINTERKIFLHFGSLSERKGTMEILDSFNYLDVEIVSRFALLLIGKTNPQTNQKIQAKISLIIQKFPHSIIIYQNEFIPDSLMKSYFEQCDYVLIPYKNVEASSGILGHAISSKKPVIATNKGLLGALVKENQLGILIDDANARELAKKIKLTVNKPILKIKSNTFIKTHTPDFFAKSILKKETA